MPDPRFPFSNFEPCLIKGKDGITYHSVENFYCCMKTTHLPTRRKYATAAPAAAKCCSKKFHLRPGWDEMKERVMWFALKQKFAPGTRHHQQLMAFEGEIVEWNTWHDTFWGRCTCRKHNGEGANTLGRMLMALRKGGTP